jgi:hypothetical protein
LAELDSRQEPFARHAREEDDLAKRHHAHACFLAKIKKEIIGVVV